MKRSAIPSVIIVLLLSTPVGFASWNAFGMKEPNTKLDQDGGWMHASPDTSSDQKVRKVYFASFLGQYPGTTANPNVAAAGTATNAPDYTQFAVLGVWKDCNKDGYIGLQEQGLLEYRSELLSLDSSVCPKETTQIDPHTGKPPLNWFPSHNDGQWVRELLPIQWLDKAPDNVIGDRDAWNINDNGARVWYDDGLPTDDLTGAPSATCSLNPQPAGTYRSTGGMLQWVGCNTGFRATDKLDSVTDPNPTTHQFSFNDSPRDLGKSHSTLNQKNPWGSESDASEIQAWDCTKPGVTSQKANDQTYVNISQPQVPPKYTTSGSPAGTANATASGFDQCNPNTHNDGSTHLGDSAAHAPYANEAASIDDATAKTQTLNLAPIEGTRPTAPAAAALGKSTPPDYGAPLLGYNSFPQYGINGGDGLWYVVTNTIDPAHVGYTTAYAYVSPAAISAYGLSLPKGASATGVYGQEACSGATSGIHRGWQCESSKWYKDALGQDTSDRSTYLGAEPGNGGFCSEKDGTTAGCVPYSVRVGAPYNLRAIDCYDQSAAPLRAQGVTYQSLFNPAAGIVNSLNGPVGLHTQALCSMAT